MGQRIFKTGNLEKIRTLLVEEKYRKSKYALYAAENERFDIVDLFLELKINLEPDLDDIIWFACMRDKHFLVKRLLKLPNAKLPRPESVIGRARLLHHNENIY